MEDGGGARQLSQHQPKTPLEYRNSESFILPQRVNLEHYRQHAIRHYQRPSNKLLRLERSPSGTK
jgi:hypothetical protein